MTLKAKLYKHTLNFSFNAGTSRGVLKKKDSYYLKIWESDNPLKYGLGEAGPLSGLSPDFGEIAFQKLQEVVQYINRGIIDFNSKDFLDFPSVWFAIETAFMDLKHGGIRKIFDSSFFTSNQKIPINGLVWMGEKEFMRKQIDEKINSGYDTIKLKIGAINFEDELDLLKYIRTEYKDLTLRVDANGAFKPSEALEKLKRLSDYNLHSIEQPIAIHQEEELAKLCEITPLSIALDEELIVNASRKKELLEIIKPQYIILKPSLMGGIEGSMDWIKNANNLGIEWWITSALESNIGLNAICQFTSELGVTLPQGLGTGKLYTNNFDSPLNIVSGHIHYDSEKKWDLTFFD